MATTTVPLTIHPRAAARVAELGREQEFQQMLDHTRETVPGLRAIEVIAEEEPYERGHASVIIIPVRQDPGPGDDPTNRNWGNWFVDTFPPEVCEHFVMVSGYEAPDAR